MKQTIALTAVLFSLASLPAFAMDLQSARASGLVGERTDGYIQALKSDPDAASVVNEVNNGRREEYARISKEKGQSESVVAKVAAEQIIQSLPAGSMYQGADGKWKKR